MNRSAHAFDRHPRRASSPGPATAARTSRRRAWTTAAAVTAAGLLAAACATDPLPADPLPEDRAGSFDAARAYAREEIDDPERAKRILALVTQLEQDLAALAVARDTSFRAVERVHLDYDATPAQVEHELDLARERLRAAREPLLVAHGELTQLLRAQEWEELWPLERAALRAEVDVAGNSLLVVDVVGLMCFGEGPVTRLEQWRARLGDAVDDPARRARALELIDEAESLAGRVANEEQRSLEPALEELLSLQDTTFPELLGASNLMVEMHRAAGERWLEFREQMKQQLTRDEWRRVFQLPDSPAL